MSTPDIFVPSATRTAVGSFGGALKDVPFHKKIHRGITADNAAAQVLAAGDAVKARGLKPGARLVSCAQAGVAAKLVALGPVPASRLALRRAGLTAADLDVIESNEAFAAQACAVTRAIVATKALHELQRINGRHALVTTCIGGSRGIAVIFERV